MNNAASVRTNSLLLLVIVGISAVSMLWLFWHFPRGTLLATFTVLFFLGVSARLGRAFDSEGMGELDRSL
jgi:uncharacterized membrane protein AbrB (regulator of aidB expression)